MGNILLQSDVFWAQECWSNLSKGNGGTFHDMMHKEIEIYVDDMIAKSESEEEHVLNLRQLFERLRKFKLKLNPAKCTFGVKSGKLLGFIVSQKGIEVDPDKKVIIEYITNVRYGNRRQL